MNEDPTQIAWREAMRAEKAHPHAEVEMHLASRAPPFAFLCFYCGRLDHSATTFNPPLCAGAAPLW